MRAAMRALLPDFSRLSLKSATGMMQAGAAAWHPPLSDPVAVWNYLTLDQKSAVVNLLQADLQRKINEATLAGTNAKTLVIKTMNHYEPMLPSWLSHQRAWQSMQWEQALSGPEYKHLFLDPDPAGFSGSQMGEVSPNQARDYGRGQVYNPYGGFENPRYGDANAHNNYYAH